ncbi:hypothetical protein [Paraburkholderia sp. BL10I2N1]|uniref:hypothetical protein n=1 Tax=Paraburkholderia sp. BL10I2N1 TaxID=1938796 RepID=UPI001FB6AE8A|nr:hypothetical protein [Paraburkholderia sp. BL10I2N1]
MNGSARAQSNLTINGVTYLYCAVEGQFCSFTGTEQVVFGTTTPSLMYDINGPFTNGVQCLNGVVSQRDPAHGYQKSCWYGSTSTTTPPPASGAWTQCATENGLCSFSGTMQVLYGGSTTANNVTRTFTNSVSCSNAAFGEDPDPGVLKSCWIQSSSTTSPPPTTAGSISCSAPTVASGGTANGLITADTPSSDRTRLFAEGTAFNVSFVTAAPAADTVAWSMQDQLGNIKGSGTFPVASGVQTSTLSCKANVAGYFAITGTLAHAGGTLPQAGTRPAGIATFGILPNVSAFIPAVTYAHLEQHRFGMQGFNDVGPMLTDLGIWQNIDNRQLSWMEPNGPNTWTPSLSDLDPFYTNGQIMRLLRLDGIPAWASPTGAYQDDAYAPTNLSYYQGYMARVGTDTAAIRKAYFPNQQNDYFQVTWEPQWADSAANFVAMYAAVYTGLHSTDPNAVVMGTTNVFPAHCVTACTQGYLQTYVPLGLGNYLDGVTTHSYYNAGTYPAHPPEQYDTDPDPANAANALDQQIRALRAEMQSFKPNMRLWSTELGISYDAGAAYGPTYPPANELYGQAAVALRAHLIILGEGAQVTYFFFGSDFPDVVGEGTFFDLTHPQGEAGSPNISPKPVALAAAALTHVIDGTQTLGRLRGLPTMVYGYVFQQLGGGKVITAMWTHNNSVWPTSAGIYSPTYSISYPLTVDAPGTSGNVTVVDMMGNPTTMAYTNGMVKLTLTESPVYVVSSNASVMQANVIAPVGYTGQ